MKCKKFCRPTSKITQIAPKITYSLYADYIVFHYVFVLFDCICSFISSQISSLLCLLDVLSSLFAICRKSVLPLLRNDSILPLSTLRNTSIVCQERSYDGPWGTWGEDLGLCVTSRACSTMPGTVCGSMINTVRNLAWELVCIRRSPWPTALHPGAVSAVT